YAIRNAIDVGVPTNTIVLLLLLPVVAFIIAASRHLVGLRGFGIFLPAALSVVFVATGPVVGIALFLGIVFLSVATRFILNKLQLRLQYLPRMAFILWVVAVGVLGVLFAAPIIKRPEITSVSIFPVLILVLLSEDFTRVQIGKSIKVALNLTAETLILALISYFFLTLKLLQNYALLNPEVTLIAVAIADVFLGRFIGLRLLEYWRFRKLINQ
ncbi:MAG: 7TM domain-containing protein, partial [Patescibacteria group bacterium]